MNSISEEIIRGSWWPPKRTYISLWIDSPVLWEGQLETESGDPLLMENGEAILTEGGSSEDWTWEAVFFPAGGGDEMASQEISGTIEGSEILLQVKATPSVTMQLEISGGERVNMAIRSTDSSHIVSYYPQALSQVRVRDPGEN